MREREGTVKEGMMVLYDNYDEDDVKRARNTFAPLLLFLVS